jgi:hypothetical protein
VLALRLTLLRDATSAGWHMGGELEGLFLAVTDPPL